MVFILISRFSEHWEYLTYSINSAGSTTHFQNGKREADWINLLFWEHPNIIQGQEFKQLG